MAQHYDLIIRNTQIIDGSGAPGFTGSVTVRGDRIVGVGDVGGDAKTVLDGEGLVTCPGFVDIHSHADSSILQYPLAENLVMQGITTFVGGSCGESVAPCLRPGYVERMLSVSGDPPAIDWRTFGEWLSRVESSGIALNCAPLVGHSAVRSSLMGLDFRRKTSGDEIEEMKQLVDEAMRAGAFGFSTGLDPTLPGHYADVEEIIELARVAGAYGAVFTPHTRHHQNQWPAPSTQEAGYGLFDSPPGELLAGRYHGLLEAVEISRAAGNVRLHIAHLTPAYLVPQPHPASLDEALAEATLVDVVDKAREEGLDVTFNVIVWEHSIGSNLPIRESFFTRRQRLPEWLRGLSVPEFAEGLRERAVRDRLKNLIQSGTFKFGMIHPVTDPYWMDCYCVQTCKAAEFVGRTIGDLAREREPDSIIKAVYEASFEVLFDILAVDPDATWALIADKRERGVLPVFLKHPASMPCSDVGSLPMEPSEERRTTGYGISPTAYGLFPHYLRKYAREDGVLTLEEAIRKATSVPAQQVLKLADRGLLREGAYADLVVFDYEQLRETTDYLNPNQPPEGIRLVMVNGVAVRDNATHTGAKPGRVLRRA